jgi:hypothetical protein
MLPPRTLDGATAIHLVWSRDEGGTLTPHIEKVILPNHAQRLRSHPAGGYPAAGVLGLPQRAALRSSLQDR